MHDPMTVAHEIKYPWKKKGYRPTLITIWHVDPETDGSDDSCGWFGPKLTEADSKFAEELAASKYDCPYPMRSDLEIILGLWMSIRHHVDGTHRRKNISPEDLGALIDLATCPWDNVSSLVDAYREGDRRRLIICLVRACKRLRRKWWQHPKWHVRHWQIQVHPLQKLRRMFERCAGCGKHFRYGYCPVSTWDGDKSWHHECAPFGKSSKPSQEGS